MGDLLEHLEELKDLEDPMRPLKPFVRNTRYPATAPDTSCIACGYLFEYDWDSSNNHSMSRDRVHQFPVCIGMNLTRNHCVYQLKCIADPGYGPDACYCGKGGNKHKPHPAERFTEYYLPRAREVWGRRVEALEAQLADVAHALGLDWATVTGEAP